VPYNKAVCSKKKKRRKNKCVLMEDRELDIQRRQYLKVIKTTTFRSYLHPFIFEVKHLIIYKKYLTDICSWVQIPQHMIRRRKNYL